MRATTFGDRSVFYFVLLGFNQQVQQFSGTGCYNWLNCGTPQWNKTSGLTADDPHRVGKLREETTFLDAALWVKQCMGWNHSISHWYQDPNNQNSLAVCHWLSSTKSQDSHSSFSVCCFVVLFYCFPHLFLLASVEDSQMLRAGSFHWMGIMMGKVAHRRAIHRVMVRVRGQKHQHAGALARNWNQIQPSNSVWQSHYAMHNWEIRVSEEGPLPA